MRPLAAFLLSLILMAPLAAEAKSAKTFSVDCNAKNPKTIASALEKAEDGDTILISGSCTETVLVNKGVTLDGQGTASVQPVAPTDTTLLVTARGVRIVGLHLEGPAFAQVSVFGLSSARVESSVLRNGSSSGLIASNGSIATVLGNTISDNVNGVVAIDGSTVRVGFAFRTDTVARPNRIENNSSAGVVVTGNSGAVIAGNQISGSNLGVVAVEGGRAQVASNTIDGNNIGLFLNTNATVQLASPGPNPLFATPNSGVNATVAILCQGGSISGQLGGFTPGVRTQAPTGALLGVPSPVPPSTFCRDQTQP